MTKEAIEIVYKFHSHLLGEIDDDRRGKPHPCWLKPLGPEWLREFADEYRKKQIAEGRAGFDFFP